MCIRDSGDLARQLGLLVKKENLGFGLRSWRYAMLVCEGNVELLNIEPNLQDNCKTDPYEKSKPEVFLEEVKSHFGLNFVINEKESEDSDSQTEE